MKPPAQPAPLPITPEQLREARAALGWSLDRVAAQSGVTPYGIIKYERFGLVVLKRGQPHDFDVLASIRDALEAAGVEFVQEDGAGPGVRLRKSAETGIMHPPQLTPQQVKAARKLLGWTQERLGARSGTTTTFVWTYENEGRVMKMLSRERSLDGLAAIRSTLEVAGIEFTNGDEPGVTLRRPETP